MKRVSLGAVAVGCLLVSSPALAQIGSGANEAFVGISLTSSSYSDGGGSRSTTLDWTSEYQRYVTDRISLGPKLNIFKTTGASAQGGIGGTVAYHFGPLDSRLIPFVEASSTAGFGGDARYTADVELRGGLKVPLGSSGARLKFGPYFYRAMYDEEKNGYDSFRSIGVFWNVGLLWK